MHILCDKSITIFCSFVGFKKNIGKFFIFNIFQSLLLFFLMFKRSQNLRNTHKTFLQPRVAKIATNGCKKFNQKLQSHLTIYSCSFCNYQLKNIATKNCLQLKLANFVFLQILVELRLHSGC